MSKNLSDFIEIENDFVDRGIEKMVQFQMLSEVQLGHEPDEKTLSSLINSDPLLIYGYIDSDCEPFLDIFRMPKWLEFELENFTLANMLDIYTIVQLGVYKMD